jgi:RNA recognition motif-containing protein
MASRLYVGGLPYETTDDELKKLFEASGTVASATVATDKGSGRSKGFGFVEMSSEEEAKSAIEAVHGTTIGERTIRVEVANVPKAPAQ